MTVKVTADVGKPYAADVHTFALSDVVGDAAILKHSTVSGEIHGDEPALRIGYAGSATATVVAEGEEVPEVGVDLDELVVQTVKVASLMTYSRELGRQPKSPDELAQAMARAVREKLDLLFLAQAAPVSPAVSPAAGLFNTASIQSQTAVSGSFDKLIDLRSAVEVAGGQPSAWIVAPTTMAALAKFKAGTELNSYLLGAGVEAGQMQLLGLPIEVNNQMAAKSGLLVSKADIYSAVSDIELAISDHAAFGKDSTQARVTARIGFGVPRPGRIGKFTVS